MPYIFIAVLVVFIVAMLFISGALSWKSKGGSKVDTVSALRSLLIERAEGKLSQEEFEQKQAAFHLSILEQPVTNRSILPWIVALLVLAGVLVVVASKWNVSQPTVDMTAANSMSASRTMLPAIPAMPTVPAMVGASPVAAPASNSGGDMATAVKRLEAKLEQNPKNGDGWLLLARSYNELGRHQDAATAFGKAAALLPASADLLADWVEAKVVSNNRKWDDESRAILKRALAADAKHIKSLSLSGSEAFERADYQQAIAFWKQILTIAPANSPDAQLAEKNIQNANAASSGKK